jgi:acetyl-CoA C-acetyltransferase
MVEWNRRVAIVGVGRTHSTTRRPDVNQAEMVNEAVRDALEDSGLTPGDIDINAIGDMELFQGDHQSDMWHTDAYGGYLKPGIRMTTGGTTGGMLVNTAGYFVASGIYNTALIVGFQKHDEGNATTGLSSIEDPLWDGILSTGVGGGTAATLINRYGKRIEEVAAKLRVQASENASRNPYAHLRKRVTVDDVLNSPMLAYPSRVLHICPQSSGACAMIFASEERARQITDKPVWIKDFTTVHKEMVLPEARYGIDRQKPTHQVCAERLYKRNGIKDPRKDLDLLEIYDPSVWFHLELLRDFLLIPMEEVMAMIERGETARDGNLPVCPSGGVLSTNAIGASAMLRVAEAALQIRGDCGAYQVEKDVKRAMATSFGGSGWAICHLLTRDLDG